MTVMMILSQISGGQKIADRIGQLLKTNSQNVTAKLNHLKTILPHTKITSDKILDPTNGIYDRVRVDADAKMYLSGFERAVVDELHLLKRAREEIRLVDREMDRCLAWHRHRHRTVLDTIDESTPRGLIALRKVYLIHEENTIRQMCTNFKKADEYLDNNITNQVQVMLKSSILDDDLVLLSDDEDDENDEDSEQDTSVFNVGADDIDVDDSIDIDTYLLDHPELLG